VMPLFLSVLAPVAGMEWNSRCCCHVNRRHAVLITPSLYAAKAKS
jgi:hypothetical protein